MPIRTSSRRCKDSERALETREPESLDLNQAYSEVQEEPKIINIMRQCTRKTTRYKTTRKTPSLTYLDRSDPDIMYFDQAMKEIDRQEFPNAAIREVNSH